jgi:glucose-1-phosphate thymidylyltransferase
MDNLKGLILAGGHGTRLRPLTYNLQKQLIPVANRPIIFYVIDDLVRAGITDIGIVVGPNKEQIIDTVGDGRTWGCTIKYIEQDAPRGLAHAIAISKEFLGDNPFVMYLGDNLIKGGIQNFVQSFKSSEVANPEQYGIALVDEQKKVITRLLEKPKDPPSNLSIVGIYGFMPSIFEAIQNIKPSWRNELEVTDAMQWLVENGHKAGFSRVGGWWKDTGSAESLLAANQLVLDDTIRMKEGIQGSKPNIQGRVQIGENSVVSDKAIVRGPVIIGDNCVIEDDVFIGPYTSVGDKVTIKQGEVENSILMDGVLINTKKRVINSIFGKGAVLDTKTRIPHGQVIVVGDNSRIESW